MTEAAAIRRPAPRRRWLPWVGGLIGAASLTWVLHGLDFRRLILVVGAADWRFIALVPLAVLGEQLVRAWKWRQLLFPLRPVTTFRLFGAIMAGYLIAILIPLGLGTVARAWLVGRREGLDLPAVLATVALDRLTDGIVFACLVPLALVLVTFPDANGGIRAGLIWGGTGSLTLFGLLGVALVGYRRGALRPDPRVIRCIARLPAWLAAPLQRLSVSFAGGLCWPRARWRGAGIVLASVLIKLVATTDFLWAGLAFGVLLTPGQYLFLVVFLGFLIVLGYFTHIAGSFLIAAVFALTLFGVAREQALAMAVVVVAASLISIACVGALSLWRQGVALGELHQSSGETGTGNG